MSPILFEQPVARNDWEGLKQVTEQANKLYGEGPSDRDRVRVPIASGSLSPGKEFLTKRCGGY